MSYKQDQTDIWLQKQGLNVKTFDTTRLEVVRALMCAKRLLTKFANNLSEEQIELLHCFQRVAANGKKVLKITDAECFCILNMHTRLCRQVYAQQRKSRKR
jgi:hypothetical protein